MVNISKFGDSAIKFTFTDNYRYLHNGEIEVPLNSLILVVDESDMVTFKKIDGDPFVSFLISDSNFESKETLIYFYKTSMVGSTGGGSESGITSGDVQTMIDTSLEDYYDIDEIDAALSGKADSSAVTEAINSAVSGKQDTLIAGSGITISGNVISAEGGNLVVELTQAEYDELVSGGTVDPNAFYIITDATEINISDYYTSAQTQSAINAAVSGKADSSSVYTKSEVDTALSGKQDTLVAGNNITISGNVISATGGGGSITIDPSLDSGSTNAVANSAITSQFNSIDARISEDEEVTAAALNALNDGKQDTIIAGSGITISGNVISAIGGGGGIDSGTVQTMIDDSISGKADTSAVTVAINSAVSGKADSSAVTEISSAVSGKMDTSVFNTYSAATDARISEDEEVTAAALNALNDKFDGLRLKKLTQAEYEALSPNYDSNTLYVIVN